MNKFSTKKSRKNRAKNPDSKLFFEILMSFEKQKKAVNCNEISRMKSNEELLQRITVNPGIMSGRPVIRSMRFPVSNILELLASGLSAAEILIQHPMLEEDDITAALLYASLKMKNTVHAA